MVAPCSSSVRWCLSRLCPPAASVFRSRGALLASYRWACAPERVSEISPLEGDDDDDEENDEAAERERARCEAASHGVPVCPRAAGKSSCNFIREERIAS